MAQHKYEKKRTGRMFSNAHCPSLIILFKPIQTDPALRRTMQVLVCRSLVSHICDAWAQIECVAGLSLHVRQKKIYFFFSLICVLALGSAFDKYTSRVRWWCDADDEAEKLIVRYSCHVWTCRRYRKRIRPSRSTAMVRLKKRRRNGQSSNTNKTVKSNKNLLALEK